MKAFENVGLIPYLRGKLSDDKFSKVKSVRASIGAVSTKLSHAEPATVVTNGSGAAGQVSQIAAEVERPEGCKDVEFMDEDGLEEEEADDFPSDETYCTWDSTAVVPPCFRPMRESKNRRDEVEVLEEAMVPVLNVQTDAEAAAERLRCCQLTKAKYDREQVTKLYEEFDLLPAAERKKKTKEMTGTKIRKQGGISLEDVFLHKLQAQTAQEYTEMHRNSRRKSNTVAGRKRHLPPSYESSSAASVDHSIEPTLPTSDDAVNMPRAQLRDADTQEVNINASVVQAGLVPVAVPVTPSAIKSPIPNGVAASISISIEPKAKRTKRSGRPTCRPRHLDFDFSLPAMKKK